MAPTKISDRPGTFAGFDLVVSISEEAINTQFLKLYSTKLDTGRLIPPSKLKKFKPLPPSEHLINHQLSLHLLNKKTSTPEKPVYRRTGIDGFIECPKVRFRPEEYDSAAGNAVDKYKKAYLEIKFKQNEVTGADSTMTYLDPDSEENATISLNGCTMVWGVKIGSKDVGNVMERIIDPAQKLDNPAALKDRATEQLKKYVNSQIFTVSTIFCLFEEKSMTDSFLLLDPDRQPIRGTALSDARHQVTLFFGEVTDEWKDNKGVPFATTENPYILGYGISQKRVDIAAIVGDGVSTADTPDCFKPKQVSLSVTPGEVKPEWTCTSGSLNYCLLTHRDSAEGHGPVDIDEADLNAGIITKNFFDVTKTMGRTLDPQGAMQGHDGIMGFSKGVFSDIWLRSIAEKLLVDPSSNEYKDTIAKGLQKDSKDVTITLNDFNKPVASSNGWKMSGNWRTNMMEPRPGQMQVGPGDQRMCVIGDISVKITYSSDSSSITSVQDGITHARRLYFDIEFENKWDFILQNDCNIANLANNPDESNNWLKQRLRGFPESEFLAPTRWDFVTCAVLAVRTKSLVRVVMNPGAVGTWNVDVDEPASKNLHKNGIALNWTKGEVYSDTYGNFQELKNFHGYTFDVDSKMIRGALTGWGTSTKDIIGDKVRDAFKGLTTTVIMPAGDVFTFAGLDTDESGNVYTQVNFANDGGFKVVNGSSTV